MTYEIEGFLSPEEKRKVFEEGYAEGYPEGYAEGYPEGYAKGLAIVTCRWMRIMNLSFEKAADDLSIPESDREKFRELVDKILQEHAA